MNGLLLPKVLAPSVTAGGVQEAVEIIRKRPPVMPLLEEAGVRLDVTDDVGPWTLSFAKDL